MSWASVAQRESLSAAWALQVNVAGYRTLVRFRRTLAARLLEQAWVEPQLQMKLAGQVREGTRAVAWMEGGFPRLLQVGEIFDPVC